MRALFFILYSDFNSGSRRNRNPDAMAARLCPGAYALKTDYDHPGRDHLSAALNRAWRQHGREADEP